jgi:hypothetical protein
MKKSCGKTILDEQFDDSGNMVCPSCKKSLRGLLTDVSDSLIAVDKHTTKKRKVQCCSEECSAKFFEKQQLSIENEEY